MCVSLGFVVFLVHAAICAADLLNPCHTTDIQCLSSNTEKFLELTSAGDEKYDFKAIDPLVIPTLEVDTISDVKIILNNVNITGLKKLKIKDFKMDIDKQSVLLAMASTPNVEADITVVAGDKNVGGKLSSQPTLLPTATYTYGLIKNEGVDYFTVGKENLTCELGDSPSVTTSAEVQAVLYKDASSTDAVTRAILCKVAESAFGTIIHNLRASAKIFPKAAYFTNI